MSSIGHYRILRKLGEGGMGIVYAAEDERLGRQVALKMILKGGDETASERLRREARAAASVNHPNVCQIYDIGEHEDELYVAMEMLDGEPLSDRLARGPVSFDESIRIVLEMLDALGALHQKQIIHRDLKPSNIFLTPRGVKLLDFGLALPLDSDDLRLTTPGMILGTPRYMAPEQWAGKNTTPATDLFACGAILYEMLTGEPAFRGESMLELCHAIAQDHPPSLTGGAEVTVVDRVIQRALEKRPAERYSSAAAMAGELRAARRSTDETVPLSLSLSTVRPARRLIVLPFRLLREDDTIDFLTLSLPDAITTSLCGLHSLVVRSSRIAASWVDIEPDPATLARKAEVDVALMGTLMRAGDQVRLKAQLIETPSGTVIWSKMLQVALGDIFQLEDELRDRLLESLAVTLSETEHRQIDRQTAPRGNAYELFLRANQLGFSTISTSKLVSARDLYRASVEEDPNFAPAWARLARVYRIMAKYGHGDPDRDSRLAEEAFDRAFALDPDLPIAHNYFTFFEVERGRAPQAMVRLLQRLETRAADPELYAGLVVACRFCGLTDASFAAHRRAVRLDPQVATSVHYTHWMAGDLEEAIRLDRDEVGGIRAAALWEMGRLEEAREALSAMRPLDGAEDINMKLFRIALDGDREQAISLAGRLLESGFGDPEGLFFAGVSLTLARADEMALSMFERSVEEYFCAHPLMERLFGDHEISSSPRFQDALAASKRKHESAREMFLGAGGERLCG